MMIDQFSFAQVNTYMWRRQGFDWDHLDRRQPVFGIYGAAPSCYLSHLVRDPEFRFESLDKDLYKERDVVRMRGMRYSVFIVPVEHLPAVYQATKEQALSVEYKIHKLANLTDDEYIEVSAAVENVLADSVMGLRQIKLALPNKLNKYRDTLQYVIPYMCAEGRLVRATVQGGWKSNRYDYARLSNWLPEVNLASVTPAQGCVDLARLYFDSYGPASEDDFQWWSGLKHDQVSAALAGLKDELVKVMIEDRECLLLEKDLEALVNSPKLPPEGLHLLPLWDAYLMAYRSRDRFLTPKHYDTIYDKSGDGTYTILVDGEAAGVWDLIDDNNRITLKAAFFNGKSDSWWEILEEWLDLLISVTGVKKGRLVRCPLPLDLKYGSRNLFRSPLKEIDGEVVYKITH